MKKKVMLMWLAVAVVAIAVPAVQAGITNNVVGGDITKGAGWDNDKPTDTNPGFIAVDGAIKDDTFGFGRDTVITQTAGTIDGGSKTMNFGAFNGTNGGGTWNMSGGTIIARSINLNSTSNSTMNISGGTLMLNGTGIELGKGAHISSSKSESYLNISGSAVLDETNATQERNTGGNYDIASNWTGYWTCGVYSGDSWKDFVVDNITLDGGPVDAATFASVFLVTDGGQTLSMNLLEQKPGNGVILPGANPLTLSWTNVYESEPNTILFDVWFGTDPCTLGETTWKQVLVGAEDATSVDVDASVLTTYSWRLDITNGDANTVEGTIFSFTTTDDPAPTVEILTPATMTWSDNSVTLYATVTDSGPSLLTYGWTAVVPEEYIGDPNLTVDFDADAVDTVVTVTNLTGKKVTVTMTLTASDSGHPDEFGEASVEIDVYRDSCHMAKGGLDIEVPAADLNSDCIINLVDFAEMASVWLDDYAAIEAVERP